MTKWIIRLVGVVVLLGGAAYVGDTIQRWGDFNTHAVQRIVLQRPSHKPIIRPREPVTLAPSRRTRHWEPSTTTVSVPILSASDRATKKAADTFGIDLDLNKPLAFRDLNPVPEGGEVAVTVNEKGGVDVTVKAHPAPLVSVDKRWGLDLTAGMDRVSFVDSAPSQRDFWSVGLRPPALNLKRRVEIFGHVSYEHSPAASGVRATVTGRVWLGHR